MTDTVFAWAVTASLGTHLVGLAAASALGLWSGTPEAPPAPVPIQVVRAEAPPAQPTPPPPPRRTPRKPSPPKAAEVAKPAVVENLLAAPPALMDDSPQKDAPVAPSLPEQRFLTGNSLMPRTAAAVPAPREGGEAGAGRLLASGDIPVRAGTGTAGGSGVPGRGGSGLSSSGSGDHRSSGGPGGGSTLTSLAHPLGGYQTSPRYPETARREGAEGVTTLRFEVLTDGRVGAIRVAKSAGHADLDQAAIDAVKTWRFEPARRGKEPVAVWVTLPVRFELSSAQ